MAVGLCCDPECRFYKQAEHALKTKSDMPNFSGSFVSMVCSKSLGNCPGQMHDYCFDKMVDKAIQELNKKPGLNCSRFTYKTVQKYTRFFF